MANVHYPKYQNRLSLKNKLGRLLWSIVYHMLFNPFFLMPFYRWRNFLLRLFGARIGHGSKIHTSVRIWAPWNLITGVNTGIGPYVICYNPGKIILGNKVSISQYAHLCAASHDFTKIEHSLTTEPIIIEDQVWVATEAFIGPGVTIGQGAIVGARACVFKDVESWAVVGGNPAKFIKKREIKN